MSRSANIVTSLSAECHVCKLSDLAFFFLRFCYFRLSASVLGASSLQAVSLEKVCKWIVRNPWFSSAAGQSDKTAAKRRLFIRGS